MVSNSAEGILAILIESPQGIQEILIGNIFPAFIAISCHDPVN